MTTDRDAHGMMTTGGAFGGGGATSTGGVASTGGSTTNDALLLRDGAVDYDTGGAAGTGGSTASDGSPSDRASDHGAGGAAGADGPDSRTPVDVAGYDAGTGGAAGGSGTVTFESGRAHGLMDGYGWASLGAVDTMSSPTCGGVAITGSRGSSYYVMNASCAPSGTTWNSTNRLCVSGTIPVVVGEDFLGNWGMMVGANSSEPPADATGAGRTLGRIYSTITVTTSGTVTPTNSAIRVLIHVLGPRTTNPYCASLPASTQPIAIALTAFNTACWDGSGTALTTADTPNIDKVAVVISADSVNRYVVSDFCLTGISFGGSPSPSSAGAAGGTGVGGTPG